MSDTTTTARTSYRVRARTTASHAEVQAAATTALIDTIWPAQPSEQPGPADLLAAALAACLLKGLNRASHLLPFRYTTAEIEVTAHRQDTPPKFTSFTYELRIVIDEAHRRVDLLHHDLRRYGTVYNTLAAAKRELAGLRTGPNGHA